MENQKVIDLYQRWANEEGVPFERKWGEDLQKNGFLFSIHEDKLLTLEMLNHFKIPHVDVRRIGSLDEAFLYHACLGRMVLRARKGSHNSDIYHCKTREEVHAAHDDLEVQMKQILAYPSYRMPTTFRVYVIDGQVEMVRGENHAPVVIHEQLRRDIQELTNQLSTLFQLGFATFDVILLRNQELKVVELKKPGLLDFANQNAMCEAAAKHLFLAALQTKHI